MKPPPESHWFQSAPPVKGAILGIELSLQIGFVSIRAPREGGDLVGAEDLNAVFSFNPRPP